MQEFLVDRHTTPATPALDPINVPKVPIYDTIADAESDLSNLEVGQIVKTKDAGLVANLNPIDEVKQGVFLPPTSNAVAECLKYSSGETFTGKVWIDENGVEHKVYRRFYYSATNWANNATVDTIANIGIVMKLENVTCTNTGDWHGSYHSGGTYAYSYINKSTGVLKVSRADVFANNQPSTITIEYTKTTD